MLNFTILDGNILVVKSFEKLKCNDTIIFFTQTEEFKYKIKKIYGFRKVECEIADSGYTFELHVDGDIKKLQTYDILYKYYSGEYIPDDVQTSFFELNTDTDTDTYIDIDIDIDVDESLKKQYYKIVLYTKPMYEDFENMSHKLESLFQILKDNSYNFYESHDINKEIIMDGYDFKSILSKYNKPDKRWTDQGFSLTFKSIQKDDIFIRMGSLNRNVRNCLNISFSEQCDFVSVERNKFFIDIYKEIIKIFSPTLAFISSNQNLTRFERHRSLTYSGVILPVGIYHINYFSDELIAKDSEVDFKIAKELSEKFHNGYLLKIKDTVIDNFSKDDLLLQKKYDDMLNINDLRINLQNHCFRSKRDILKYN